MKTSENTVEKEYKALGLISEALLLVKQHKTLSIDSEAELDVCKFHANKSIEFAKSVLKPLSNNEDKLKHLEELTKALHDLQP
jgi:hypothetical protein